MSDATATMFELRNSINNHLSQAYRAIGTGDTADATLHLLFAQTEIRYLQNLHRIRPEFLLCENGLSNSQTEPGRRKWATRFWQRLKRLTSRRRSASS